MKYALLLLIGGMLITACTSTPSGQVSANVDDQQNQNNINNNIIAPKNTVITTQQQMNNWCQTGTDWSSSTTSNQGYTNAQWKIDKLETTGTYEGFCHVIYTAQGPDGDVRIDYWFDQTGANGYYEMDINGEKYTQQWRG